MSQEHLEPTLPMTPRARRLPRWLTRTAGACVAALVLSPAAPALADCQGPVASILWSYPDTTTGSVPPDAVFWAVSQAGTVTVTVDGVALTPLGTDLVDAQQFISNEPLSLGVHELVARASRTVRGPNGNPTEQSEERRLAFTVAASNAPAGDVSIRGVTVYPADKNVYGPSVAPEERDLTCTLAATELGEVFCDDLIYPRTLARIEYESTGGAIAYLVQGRYIVPPGCASFWTQIPGDVQPEAFSVAAVLPNGLAADEPFTGSIEVQEPSTPPGVKDQHADRSIVGCSLGVSGARARAPGGLGAAFVLALAAWRLRRRR